MREIKFRAWQRDPITSEWHMIQSLGHWKVYELNSPTPDEEIVMQYTGLKDKNGVEIYEGDIVATPSTHYGDREENEPIAVEWADDEAGFGVFGICGHCGSNWIDSSNCAVIGNIYENKDLLNGQ